MPGWILHQQARSAFTRLVVMGGKAQCRLQWEKTMVPEPFHPRRQSSSPKWGNLEATARRYSYRRLGHFCGSSTLGCMSTAIEPQERLWREANWTLATKVITRLDMDPDAAPDSYAERLAWAAQLLEREARKAGMRGKANGASEPGAWKYGIDPNKLYTAQETAPLLGLTAKTSAKAVYKLGRLPQGRGLTATRVGAKSGRTKFRGQHIIEYLERKSR